MASVWHVLGCAWGQGGCLHRCLLGGLPCVPRRNGTASPSAHPPTPAPLPGPAGLGTGSRIARDLRRFPASSAGRGCSGLLHQRICNSLHCGVSGRVSWPRRAPAGAEGSPSAAATPAMGLQVPGSRTRLAWGQHCRAQPGLGQGGRALPPVGFGLLVRSWVGPEKSAPASLVFLPQKLNPGNSVGQKDCLKRKRGTPPHAPRRPP